MSRAQLPFLYQLLYLVRERQDAEEIRHCRPVLADRFGDLLLRQLKIVDQPAITASLFERVEVGALKILDEGQDEHGPVIEVPHDCGNLGPAQVRCRPQPTLACDELERVAAPAYGDRLKQP